MNPTVANNKLDEEIHKIIRLLESILPNQENRKKYLNILIEAINYANSCGSCKWGTQYKSNRIWLLVGDFVVLSIQKDIVWLALDQKILEDEIEILNQIEKISSWKWDDFDYPSYTKVPSKNGFYKISQNHLQDWNFLKELHFKFIDRISEKYKQLRMPSQLKHSKALLSHLRYEFQVFIPEPVYVSNTQLDLIIEQNKIEVDDYFELNNLEDARRKILSSIVQRQGQPKFRRKLMGAYGGICPITGCDVESAIEAAHIVPYQGENTNHIANGLPLRADIHTLFDLYLFSVKPDSHEVVISPHLLGTCYQSIAGKILKLPEEKHYLPTQALAKHYEIFVLKWLFQ